MYYAYGGQPIIVVDVHRADSLKYLIYDAIEKLKDGNFFGTEYESRQYIRDHGAHVIVFSNQEPDYTKWTPDRYNFIRLSDLRAQSCLAAAVSAYGELGSGVPACGNLDPGDLAAQGEAGGPAEAGGRAARRGGPPQDGRHARVPQGGGLGFGYG